MEEEMTIGKGINKVGLAIICVGLAFLAVKYDSLPCGIGAIIAFICA